MSQKLYASKSPYQRYGHLSFEQVNINEDWEELSELTIQQYRMEYAQKLVNHLQDQTAELIDIWSIEGGNYGLKLLDGSTYRSR